MKLFLIISTFTAKLTISYILDKYFTVKTSSCVLVRLLYSCLEQVYIMFVYQVGLVSV